jgi:hypothetical protein
VSTFEIVRSHPDGDGCRIDVRLVVAPRDGRFEAGPPESLAREGEPVRRDDVIGLVVQGGGPEPVRSFCTGLLVRVLAEPGEQVRAGQPLAWVHPEDR